MQQKELRKGDKKVIAGVCQGMADYFNMRADLMRVIWVVAALLTSIVPVGALYVILAFGLPDAQGRGGFTGQNRGILWVAGGLIALGGYLVLRTLLPALAKGLTMAALCLALGVFLLWYGLRRKG
ncbi:MAG: PspC domain-containing protein [Eubacteriales bacterium]|nr:PspC domain-containing protein [Eubacteriales bacterium]